MPPVLDPHALLRQGAAYHQAGQLAQAQALYRQVLAAVPGQPDALHLLGVMAHQTGHSAEAEKLIRQAISRAPQAVGYQSSLGHVLRALQRATEAEAAYRAVLRQHPNVAENHHNLALALRDQGRTQDAEAAFRQALRLQRDFVPARLDLGNLLIEAGRPRDAEACLRAAVRTAPQDAVVRNALGLALIGQGQHAAALEVFEQALRLAPTYHNAALNRANCLAATDDFAESARAYAALVQAVPDDAEVRHAYARVLLRLSRGPQAAEVLRALVEQQPENASAWQDLAGAYALQDRADLALPCLQNTVRLEPENAQAWYELGLALRDLARWPEAVAPHAKAVHLQPENADMRSCYAYALLANGQFDAGWEEFRWRVKKPGNVRLAEPEWDGQPTRQTVIIHAEQGIGDTLQFCRFIPQAAALARVVVACPPSLQTLMQGLPNVAEVAVGQPVPAYDLHCPLMSLPALLAIPPERFGETVPYLHADPARIELWRGRLAGLKRPLIGVVWAGNPQYPADRKRSVPFAELAPLLEFTGASFVSVQMGDAAAAGHGHFAYDAAPLIGDYADTAALLAALDLLISVDTSSAHLAGALGRPVWLLNRAATDWRWLLEGAGSAWYPTMRIFRQLVPGDWPTVMASVMNSLRALAQQGSASF